MFKFELTFLQKHLNIFYMNIAIPPVQTKNYFKYITTNGLYIISKTWFPLQNHIYLPEFELVKYKSLICFLSNPNPSIYEYCQLVICSKYLYSIYIYKKMKWFKMFDPPNLCTECIISNIFKLLNQNT